MNPRVREVEPLENQMLFNTVRASHGTVEWVHEQDICPDWLYEDSVFFNQ